MVIASKLSAPNKGIENSSCNLTRATILMSQSSQCPLCCCQHLASSSQNRLSGAHCMQSRLIAESQASAGGANCVLSA